MPSKLPVIKANTSEENIEKMKVIAKAHKRSVAKELEMLIEKHIKDYEAENGEIETLGTIITDNNTGFIEKAKKSFKRGYKVGMEMEINIPEDEKEPSNANN